MAQTLNDAKITFKGRIELAFVKKDGTRIAIDNKRIVYINFTYDYFGKVMPMVILSATVSIDMYRKMINGQESCHLFLSIDGYNVLSNRSISKQRISGIFKYITSNTNQPFDIDTNNSSVDDTYMGITLGLIDENMISSMRQPFNGVYTNISMKKLISIALNGMKICYEPIHQDFEYDQIVIPACSTRFQFLRFLYEKDQFYKTYFRFFMDFKRSYLLSQLGNGIQSEDGTITDVILDIRPITSEESFTDGFEIKNNAYYIYLNQMNVNVKINAARNQITNKIVSYNDDANPVIYKFEDSGDKTLYVRTEYDDASGNIYKEQIDSAKLTLDILKSNIDENIFQLNYKYSVKFYGNYSKYNGTYILSYKRVIYQYSGDEFQISCNVGLIPASNNIPIGLRSEDARVGEQNSSNLAASSSAMRTSSSSTSNNNTFRSRNRVSNSNTSRRVSTISNNSGNRQTR